MQEMTTEKWYGEIFKTNYGWFCRYAMDLLKDPEDAKDAVLDAFEKVWVRLPELQSETILFYLKQTVYHTCVDHLKRRRNSLLIEEWASDEPVLSPEEEMIQAEIVADLYKRVEQLPPKMQEVIKKKFYGEMSIREAAIELNKSEQTVYAQEREGLNKLKNIINPRLWLCIVMYWFDNYKN